MDKADCSETQDHARQAGGRTHAAPGAGDQAGAFPLSLTQQVRPPYSPNGSQPLTIVETSDLDTGEVFEFESTEKPGFYIRHYSLVDHQNARSDRYAMRSAVDTLLPYGHRLHKCGKFRLKGQDIELKKTVEHQRAFISGAACCGSVWGCPICAPKITERRRLEVAQGMATAKERGLKVYLLTLTVPHGMGDDVRLILHQMHKAWRKGTDSRQGKVVRKAIGLKGTIRVLEVTYGENGFHPHFHAMLFLDTQCTPKQIQSCWYPIWLDGCRKSGLADPSERHGCHVEDGKKAARYLTKWGLDSELTKGHLKKGKKSVNPWDLLRAYTFGLDNIRISPQLRETMTGLGIDRHKAGALWYVFFSSFTAVPTRQLYWSNGLRSLLGLSLEKTDQEVAEEQTDVLADVLAVLNAHWPDIILTKSIARLLNQAEDSADLIPDLLAEIRKHAFQIREFRSSKKRKRDLQKYHRIVHALAM